MAPNSSKSDECNNNLVVLKNSGTASGFTLIKDAGAAIARTTATPLVAAKTAPTPAPAPSAPYFCCKGRQFHLYSGLMRHIKVIIDEFGKKIKVVLVYIR